MKWIQRSAPWLALCLAVIACLLAWELWQQSREHARIQVASVAQTQSLAELQAQLAGLKSKQSPPEIKGDSAQPKSAATPPSSRAPKVIEAAKAVAQLAALREKQLFRRNALSHYRAGLDALHLPAQTLTQVKDLILADGETRMAAFKKARTDEERIAIAEQAAQKEAEKLTPLLGVEGYENLKASGLVESLDWDIGTDLWDGGAPLSQEQVHAIALAQVRTEAKRTLWFMDPLPTQIPDEQTQLSVQDTALLAATASVLSPTQQELLRRSLIEENQYNSAMRGFRKQQEKLWKQQ